MFLWRQISTSHNYLGWRYKATGWLQLLAAHSDIEEVQKGCMWKITQILPASQLCQGQVLPTYISPAISSFLLYRLKTHSAGSPAISCMAGTPAGQRQWECEQAGTQTPGRLLGSVAEWLLNSVDLTEISSCRFNEPPWEAPNVNGNHDLT